MVGRTIDTLPCSQLPTNRQCLQRLFYLHQETVQNTNTKELASTVASEALSLYHAVPLTTIRRDKAADKISGLYEKWRNLEKNRKRDSATERRKRQQFEKGLDALCDLSKEAAEKEIRTDRLRNEEDKKSDISFLRDQRKGRKLHMGSVDTQYVRKAQRKTKRQTRHHEATSSKMCHSTESETQVLSTESEDDADQGNTDMKEDPDYTAPKETTRSDDTLTLTVPRNMTGSGVAATFDRCNISSEAATHVLASVVTEGGGDLDEVSISASTIRRRRNACRKVLSDQMKQEFSPPSHTVVHWDGKMLQDEHGEGKSERLAVMVSGNTEQCVQGKILSARKIESSTGEDQAAEVFRCLQEWSLEDTVRAMCFDTTASNTGRKRGAAIKLEQKLGKKLLYLACRHHIQELSAKAVWTHLFGSDHSPETTLFKDFQSVWSKINKDEYETLHLSEELLQDQREDVLRDLKDITGVSSGASPKMRADYKECADLTIKALKGSMSHESAFLKPGACHKARWMANVLYGVKMFMFRSQLLSMGVITEDLSEKLRRFTVYVTLYYVREWLTSTVAQDAAVNDLNQYRTLSKFSSIDPDISKVAMAVMRKHSWYLTEELVPMALVSEKVDDETKRLLASSICSAEREQTRLGKPQLPELPSDVAQVEKLTLVQFVGPRSDSIFNGLGISTALLEKSPPWDDDAEYQQFVSFVTSLRVTNDTAERGVKLISDYIGHLTKDDEARQDLLHVVEAHRKRYPDNRKATLKESF